MARPRRPPKDPRAPLANPRRPAALGIVTVRERVHGGRVLLLRVEARRGKVRVGYAAGEVGRAEDLRAYRRASSGGGWAAEEWALFRPEERIGYFKGLGVNREERGHGLGRDLAERFVSALDRAGVETAWLEAAPMDEGTDFEGLVRLYESLGFRQLDRGRDPWEESTMLRRRPAPRPNPGAKGGCARTVFGLDVVEEEEWPGGRRVTWLRVPMPAARKPPVSARRIAQAELRTVRVAELVATQRRVTAEGVERCRRGVLA